jgi:hypothetical protein
MSRALAPRWPVSRRLTLEGLTISRSATCSAVQFLLILSVLSSVPSSRRLTVGLPPVGTPVTPLSMVLQHNTGSQLAETAVGKLKLVLANGACQGDY